MGCKNAKDQALEPTNIKKDDKRGLLKKKPFKNESIDSKDGVVPLNQKFFLNTESLVKQTMGNVYDFYEFKNSLGEGGYGSVFLCIDNKTSMSRAVKLVNKKKIKSTSLEGLFNEINILKSLDHPNIMKIYEYFNDENYLYVVGELIEGGELYDFVCERGSLEEKDASEIMKQVLSTICYLHSKKIIHRDLKPENILMTSKNHVNLNIKIIDFGISLVHSEDSKLTEKIGTPMYVAPEVISGNYNEKCDEWSAGVILYTLLTGYPPFQSGKNAMELLKAVKSGNYNKEIDEFLILSNEAKDLISKLMTLDPEARTTAEKALQHPWFVKSQGKAPKTLSAEKKNIVENLQKYRADRKIQLAIFYFFAHFLTLEEEKEKLMEMFRLMDKDSNGVLSRSEIAAGLRQNKHISLIEADKLASQIMAYGDLNQNDKIDYSEFLTATSQREKLLSIQKIETVFSMFDKDGDGKISLGEFKAMFAGKNQMEDATWKEVFKEADEDNDNFISSKEFKDIMLKLVNSSKQ